MTIYKHVAFAMMAACASTPSSPKSTKGTDVAAPEVKVALMVRIEAKPEHAESVAQLLRDGRAFVMDEPGTPYWFAVRLSDTSFGIFDAFNSDAARAAHLQGKLASALLAKARHVLSSSPVIQPVEIIGNKHAFATPCRDLGFALIARLEAKPERAGEVAALLVAGKDIVRRGTARRCGSA